MKKLCAALSLLLLCLAAGTRAQTFSFQIPGLPTVLSSAPAAAPAATPAAAPSFSSAPVLFNNQPLFQVYADTEHGAQDRAALASLRLSDALNDLPKDAAAVPPRVTVDTGGETRGASETILRLGPEPLLTVTDADITNSHEDAVTLGNVWAERINAAFRQALHERTPAYLRRAAIKAGFIVLGGVIVQLVLWFGRRPPARRAGLADPSPPVGCGHPLGAVFVPADTAD